MTETPETVLERIPRGASVLCIGLHGALAEVFAFLVLRGHPLPWVVDRGSVDQLDVDSGHYLRRDLGVQRRHAVFRMLARRTCVALPREGQQAEGPLVDKAARDYLDGALDADSWIAPLVGRFDLVLQMTASPAGAEWDLPVDPATRVLQYYREPKGGILLAAATSWAERYCARCVEAIASGLGTDCACRTATGAVGSPVAYGWPAQPEDGPVGAGDSASHMGLRRETLSTRGASRAGPVRRGIANDAGASVPRGSATTTRTGTGVPGRG